MQKSLNGLRCFIDSEERTPKDIYKFVRFYEPEAVADLKKVKAYLFKDFNDSAKVHQLLAAVRVKEYLTENRDHNRQSRRPYDVYKLLYPQGTISEKNFNEGFEIIDAVELVDEGGDINASKTVARWRAMGESRESILRFLKAIAASSGVVPDLYQLSDGAMNGKISKKEFFETVKLFAKSGPSGTIDALCALEFGEKSDAPLENALVYYSVSSALREGDSVLIIEPSCEFVRKWMLDEYIRDCPVTFAVSDKEVRSVLAGHYKAMKYAQFVTVENITDVIEKTILNHVIIFGTRYFDTSTLVRTLKEKAKGDQRVSMLVPDVRVFKGALHKELCDGKIYDREVALFPSGISGATSPKRKLLLKFLIGNSRSEEKEAVVKVGAYSILEGKPQKLQKKILTSLMSLREFDDGRSFREALRKKELGALQKTNRKRTKAYEVVFSEEITINYTLAECADGRYDTCAYAQNPTGILVRGDDNNLSRLTRKSTRKLSALEAPNWVKEEYPYGEIKAKGKTISIRREIGRFYQAAYRGKSVTLKTLVYLYPEVERRLNKHEKEQLKKVIGSELGDVQVDSLFRHYVENILDDLYENDLSGDDRYIALKIVSMAVDTAVCWKHATKNDLIDVLDRERREKKRLHEIRHNLVKKNFTRKEMRSIYAQIRKGIKKGEYELIGLLIRLLTGLENNVVCALKWKDLRKISDDGCFEKEIWQLNICRKLRKDGQEFLPFEKIESYRKIPCAMLLAELLLEERERQLCIVGSEEKLAEQQIVQAKKGMVKTNGVPVFPPDLLARCARRIIAAAGIEERWVVLPDGMGGIIETDLSSYHGDILQSNYAHWAKADRRWTEGELAYVLGKKAEIVFNRNYCHFENERSQWILFEKQNSIASVLLGEEPIMVCDKVVWGQGEDNLSSETEYFSPENSTSRAQTTAEFLVEPQNGDVQIHVENEFGFDIMVSEVKD